MRGRIGAAWCVVAHAIAIGAAEEPARTRRGMELGGGGACVLNLDMDSNCHVEGETSE